MVLGFLGSDRDVLRRERDNGLKSMYLRIKLGFGICVRERERERIGREGHRDELLLWFP